MTYQRLEIVSAECIPREGNVQSSEGKETRSSVALMVTSGILVFQNLEEHVSVAL